MTRFRFYIRRFLNLRGHHGGAYVLAQIEESSVEPEWPGWYPTFEVGDCSRRVVLEFPLDDAAARRNSLRKARLLAAETAAAFADALAAEATVAALSSKRRRDGDEVPS